VRKFVAGLMAQRSSRIYPADARARRLVNAIMADAERQRHFQRRMATYAANDRVID
jgi:hypothetical protein